jgi:hypothetical protein
MHHQRAKLTLEPLREQASASIAVNILSFDPDIYLLEVVVNDQ